MDEPLISESVPAWRSPAGPGRPGPLVADSGGPSGRRWPWVLGALAVVLGVVVLVGSLVRLPYYTIAPGSALDVNELVSVDGARAYPPDGAVLLLFVRQRARVNVWRWLQASLDSDIELYREQTFAGTQSPADLRTRDQADMEQSQISAKKVALERLGYDVPFADDGLAVLAVFGDRPAGTVLQRGDVLLSADGTDLVQSQDLSRIVEAHDPGDTIEVRYLRDGETRTARVGTTQDSATGRTVIGVYVTRRYDFPVDITIDTGSIGGPSAGLAMTLSILDELTPGDLTGGQKVAVTGAINDDATIGLVGAVTQKAVAARASGAELFLVPACPEGDAACRQDLARAEARAGDLHVVPVGDLSAALAALEEAGGDPLPAPSADRRAA